MPARKYHNTYINNADGTTTLMAGDVIGKIDTDMVDIIKHHHWSLLIRGPNHRYFRTLRNKKNLYLHHVVVPLQHGLHVDHINHDTLNNTRANLRLVNRHVNAQNRRGANHDSKTGVRGVSWSKSNKRWLSTVLFGPRRHHKFCATFEEACEWVKQKRAELANAQ